MKKLRKIVSFFITACIAVSTLATSVSAEDNFEPLTFNTLDEYIEYSIPRHLYAQQMETSEVLEYSNPIALYDFTDNTVVGSEIFLLDNGQLIGKMDIYGDSNNYSSYFDTYITDEMREAYINEKSIAIGGYENSIFLYTNTSGFIFIDGLKSDNMPNTPPTELSKVTIGGNVLSYFPMTYSIATVNLSVPHVHNSTNKSANGQCWAAAAAMIINYHSGSKLDADSVYDELDKYKASYTTPNALSYLGYSNYSSVNGAMTSGDVTSTLQNDKPVIMHISRTGGKHAVVICGITLDVSSSTYKINDPNFTEIKTLVTNVNPSTVNSVIEYRPDPKSNRVYTKWYYSYY